MTYTDEKQRKAQRVRNWIRRKAVRNGKPRDWSTARFRYESDKSNVYCGRGDK